MKKFGPLKWLPWGILGVGLPMLAATAITTEDLKNDILARATTSVTSNEALKWASVSVEHRDATVFGKTVSREVADAAAKAVSETYGVRSVVNNVEVVELPAPTIDSLATDKPVASLTGTWPSELATVIAVTVDGTTYRNTETTNLKTEGDKWTLQLPTPLGDGEYAVKAEVTAAGNVVKSTEPTAKITIKLPPPPDVVGPAMVTLAAIPTGAAWPYAITGTFDEADTKSLSATVDGRQYTMNRGAALTSDGKGNFIFLPAGVFAPGQYNVELELTDVAGNVTRQTVEKAIVVAEPPPPEPTPAPPPIAPAAPTVTKLIDATGAPVIQGTWTGSETDRLTVVVNGRAYVLGQDANLRDDGQGNWRLLPAAALKDGIYDVVATVTSGEGLSSKDSTVAEIEVDTTGPAAPALDAATGAESLFPLTGTFNEKDTKTFTATVDGRTYAWNSGAALTSDGSGKFTFAPARKFAPGSYNIDFALTDKLGNSTTFTAEKSIVVAEPPPPPPPPPDVTGPAAPVLNTVGGTVLKGSYDAADTKSMTAVIEGQARTYTLDRGAALTSDGAGGFTFAPAVKLAPGKYNVEFVAVDSLGNPTAVKIAEAIIVPEPPPQPLPPAGETPAVEPPAAEAPASEPPATEPPVAEMPEAPTVTRMLDLTGAPIIKGTWSNASTNQLSVAAGGRSYELGKDANLRADSAGNWSLFPAAALKDGTYDIVATVTNAAGLKANDTTVAELEVDGTVPAAPTITAMAVDTSPTALLGTWDEKNATGLTVSLPTLNLKAELNAAGSALTSDGGGNWTLALSQPISPGTYDVLVQSMDRHGRIQDDSSASEISIVAAGVTPKQDAPYDCVALLDRISTVFPMRFDTDTTDFAKKFALSVNQYAALLKDPRCTGVQVELAGHADERGDDAYNQMLSVRRAERVMALLKDAGVDAARMNSVGYGEGKPINTEADEDSWSVNRRVELLVKMK